MRVNRVALAVTAVTSLLVTAACSSASGSGTKSAKNAKIVYIQGVAGNPFYTSVGCGGAAKAKELGVNFSQQAPQSYDPTLQVPIVDSVVASHPDAIMIAEDSPQALIAPLARANAAGIKVLMVDGALGKDGIAISNVQSDNEKGGEEAADAIAKLIGEKGPVFAMYNRPGSPSSDARINGFKKELTKYPGITYLGVQTSNNDTSRAASIVQSVLLAHPDLAGVFTATTNNTEGVATGLISARKSGTVKLVGFDTSDPIVKDIQQGIVQADVVQAPYQIGEKEVQMAVDALNGKSVPSEVHTPFVVATPQNVNTAEVQSYIYKTHC